jgi:peptide/nickel transport system substrate-binding protein
MSPRQNRITVLLGLGLGLGCSPRETPRDTMVVVIETPMTTDDPRFALTTYDGKLSKLVAAGLTAIDTPTLEPRLALAERIDRIDNITWDVTIRADAKFSDGSDVTAADVVATYQSVLAPKSASLFHKGFSERFTAVEAISDRVARFHLIAPLATLQSDLDFGILAFHPGTVGVVGAGPYALRELTSTEARLDANPYYLGGPPRLPHLEIRFVGDAAARILMLVGGSADLIQNAVRLDLVDDVAAQPRVAVHAGPSVILTHLLLNNTDPALADVRVRQAIALAIDRKAIVAAKYGGRAVLATGLLPPTHWAYNGDVARYDYDPARARALLDAAGFRDPDGPGPLPRLHLVYKTSADAFRVTVARVIAAQLAAVGIEVEVRAFEFATFFADLKKGQFQLATLQTADISDPDYFFAYYNSSRIPDAANPDGLNRWFYRNADVDAWTLAARHELDPVKRKALYAKIQAQVAQDVPMVPLWHEDNVVLTGTDVAGYQLIPNARLAGLVTATKAP